MSRTRSAARPRRIAHLNLQPLEDRTVPATLPPGFTEAAAATGLSSPTAMEFAPNGDLWVLQQAGLVKRFRPGSTTADVVGDLSGLGLSSAGERGVLGIAFDPAYATNKFVYLYYTSTDAPNPHNRVSRFTVDDTNANDYSLVDTPGNPALLDEVEILNLDPLSSATNHNGGAIHFGPDGKLYIAVGDNANGANSQSIGTRLGKILRINPDGSIPTDNPTSIAGITGTTSGANRAIWAAGLRNPFTFAFQPGTGVMHINDVGQNTWEEIDVGGAGRNYGWQTTEGNFNQSSFPNFTLPLYTYQHGSANFEQGFAITGGTFYNPATNQFPAEYAGDYFYADFVNNWINVINANGTNPRRFATDAPGTVDLRTASDGSLYYLARGANQVFRVAFQAPGITQHPGDVTADAGQPATFTVVATGGAPLSYQWQKLIGSNWTNVNGATAASFTIGTTVLGDAGQYRVVVTNSAGSATSNPATLTVTNPGQAPNITQQPGDQSVNVGDPASFVVAATGAAPLSYQWQKLIGSTWTNVTGATAATLSFASAAVADAGQYRAVVTNSVNSATSNAATLAVNRFPTATITAGGTYTFGQTINFSATATDPEDGTLPASAYTWRVDFGHDTHFHPHVAEFSGTTGSSFVANFNEAAPDQFYRVILKVQDSKGAVFTTTFDVQPVLAQLSFGTNPAGVPLTIDGQPVSGTIASVVGMPRTILAPATATVNGTPYVFADWSDGGTATHVVTTPAANATYTADYTPALYKPGLKAEFFDFTTRLSMIPDLSAMPATVARTDATVNYPPTTMRWPRLGNWFLNTFATRHTGFLVVPADGDYTLFLKSNDGSKLWIDGQLAIDNDGRHAMVEKSTTLTLTAGYHAIRSEFFEDQGSAGLILSWSGPGIAKQVIPTANLATPAPVGPRAYQPDASGMVVMEAEDMDGSAAVGGKTWTEFGAGGFAGAGAMKALPNTGVVRNTNYVTMSPRLDYRVNFDRAGTFYVWVRGIGTTMMDDSVHVGLDGAAQTTADRITGLPFLDGWTRRTGDGPVATITVDSPGVHTLNLWMREDGAAVDRIILTPSATFKPTGVGPTTSAHVVPGLNFGNGFAGPAGLTTNGTSGVVGSTLRLTNGGTNQAGSAFATTAVSVGTFATTFDFRLTSAVAEGFAFVIQGNSATSLGSNGSGLGYQGIGNSLALTFDLSDNTTGFYTNGAAPTAGGVDLTAAGLDLRSGHAFRAAVGYTGGTLWLTLRDLETGVSVTRSYTANVSGLVGGPTAFVGFTGSTGSSTATQEVLNWAYWG